MKTSLLCLPLLYPLMYTQMVSANFIEEIEKTLEEKRLQRLVIAKKGVVIQPFTTDGCSGGLSAGWEYLSDKFDGFSAHFGQHSPWQQCCIEHDKTYWQGETANGYNLRLQADNQLKLCVEETGIKLAPSLNKKLNQNLHKHLNKSFTHDEEDITLSFKIAAELMYRAVRLGGSPCTPFPWRWGYGWPHCSFKNNDKNNDYE